MPANQLRQEDCCKFLVRSHYRKQRKERRRKRNKRTRRRNPKGISGERKEVRGVGPREAKER